MKFDEGVGQRPGVLPLPFEEDALVGNKDIVEDRQRIDHAVLGTDRVMELAHRRRAKGAGD